MTPELLSKVPATLNGYPVIAAKEYWVNDDGTVYRVMMFRPHPAPYVVAQWHKNITQGWMHGHYFSNFDHAIEEFRK